MAKATKTADAAKATKTADAAKVAHYEEWKCELKKIVEDGKVKKIEPEKLKIVRPCVKISDEEAEMLNSGVLNGANQIVNMYFKAD